MNVLWCWMQPGLFILHIKCSIPRAASLTSHRRRSDSLLGRALSYLKTVVFWQKNSVSSKTSFSFHHSGGQHGKDFLSWKNDNNCSGWAHFKTWTLCSKRQEAGPSGREENLRNQDVSLCLSVFSLTQQCGAMSFHQPPVRKSGVAVKLIPTFRYCVASSCFAFVLYIES